jgi:hypothetical protein
MAVYEVPYIKSTHIFTDNGCSNKERRDRYLGYQLTTSIETSWYILSMKLMILHQWQEADPLYKMLLLKRDIQVLTRLIIENQIDQRYLKP